jgi:hypothetical protein
MSTVPIGFDPDGVRALGRRTDEAIRGLDAIRSSDPAAAHAMRVLRLTRQTLADHWMPLIRTIESSTAMTRWAAHPLNLDHSGRLRAATWLVDTSLQSVGPAIDAAFAAVLSRLDDDELLRRLEELCDSHARSGTPIDPNDERWVTMIGALAAELDVRLADDRDGSFRRALVRAAPGVPLIALAVGPSSLLDRSTFDLARAMLAVEPWVAELHPFVYEAAVEGLLASLRSSPDACLDLLTDELALRSLASWESLDAGLVSDVVWRGLYEAVADEPRRIVDGYDVLTALTRLANGPLDDGFTAGMARGVAESLVGYIDTLAPAVRTEGNGPVLVIGFEPDFETMLGTYDDVVDLVGAIVRDEQAQAAVGIAIGSYTDDVVATLGAHVDEYVGLEYVTRFADLIGDATRSEQAEVTMAVAEAAAWRQRMGELVGFGAHLALGPSSSLVGHVLRSTSRQALGVAASVGPRSGTAMPDLSIPAVVYDHLTVAIVERAAAAPATSDEHLSQITAEQWRLVDEHLRDIDDAADDPVEQAARTRRMERYVEQFVPPLAAYLRRARQAPNVDELTESRSTRDPDRPR